VPSAARAAPGWPAICVYAAFSALRDSTNIAASTANGTPMTSA
jgi:hypothetical protein